MADPLTTLSEADKLIAKKQYEYATFLLTDCIKKNIYKTEALVKRATCYMHLHQHRNAIKDFENALKLDRTIETAYIKQSKCYLAIGDLQNAINALVFLRQIDNNENFAKFEIEKLEKLNVLNKKAEKLFEENKFNEVIEIMDKCLEQAKICVKFKLTKAECLVYLGQYNDAFDVVGEILFANNDDYEAICIRSLSLMHQKKYSLGLTELREITTISLRAKNMYRSYKRIIECLKQANIELENNKLNEAETLYREALNLDNRNQNKNRDVLTKLARILLKRNEYEKCIEMTSDILEHDEDNIKALEYRAKCNLELKEYDLAIEDYRKILKQPNVNNLTEIRRNLNTAEQKAKTEYDNYKILNLTEKNITAKAIKQSYRKLALLYHPDKQQATSTNKYIIKKLNAKFNRITKAKDELLKIYDK